MKPVIDANVVIHGRERHEFQKAYTVPEVFEEMQSSEAQRRMKNLDIEIHEPEKDSLEKTQEKSREINSPTSEADEKLVALADSLSTEVVSDDRAVQNLALHLGIDFQGYMEDEIDEKREWKIVCENCGMKVSSSPCPHCGHESFLRKSR
ncbi:MAG: NOB1 family endonuclease [Candidatus Nanosalina sp.]